jgi:hypothetical protein
MKPPRFGGGFLFGWAIVLGVAAAPEGGIWISRDSASLKRCPGSSKIGLNANSQVIVNRRHPALDNISYCDIIIAIWNI